MDQPNLSPFIPDPNAVAVTELTLAVFHLNVILIRNRNSINNPVPSGNAFDPFWNVFHIAQCVDEMVFQRVDAVEYTVVKILLAQLIPEMLLWVQFGRIRWQEQQAQIVGQTEILAFVPAGAIEHHNHVVVRLATGNLVNEDLHAVRVDLRQHQAVETAILRTHRAIGVGVLLRHHGAEAACPGGGTSSSAYR